MANRIFVYYMKFSAALATAFALLCVFAIQSVSSAQPFYIDVLQAPQSYAHKQWHVIDINLGRGGSIGLKTTGGSVRADLRFGSSCPSYVSISTGLAVDLQRFDRIQIGGSSSSRFDLFVGFEDAAGNRIFYGPHGADRTNMDFAIYEGEFLVDVTPFDTYEADWPVVVESERNFDFGRVRAILLQFSSNSAGEPLYNETVSVEISRLRLLADGTDRAIPQAISPNGDGLRDGASIELHLPETGMLSVSLTDEFGEPQGSLYRGPADAGRFVLPFDPGPNELSHGEYFIEANLNARFVSQVPIRVLDVPERERLDYELGANLAGSVFVAGERSAYNATPREYYERSFSTASGLGFRGAIVVNPPEEDLEVLLQAADRAGIEVAPSYSPWHYLSMERHIVSELELAESMAPGIERLRKLAWDHPSLTAIYLRDEPKVWEADNLGAMARIVEDELDLPALFCLNRLPRMPELAGGALPALLVTDAYPLEIDDAPGQTDFPGAGYKASQPMDLHHYTQRAGATSPDVDHLAVIQGHAWENNLRQPSPDELRLMAWLSIAGGADGINVFMLNDAHDMQGLLDEDGRPRNIAYEAGELAQLISELYPLLRTLSPLEPVFQQNAVGDLVVSWFRDDAGTLYLVAVNHDVGSPLSGELCVTLPFNRHAVTNVHDIVRDEAVHFAYGLGNKKLTLTLDLRPGEGVIWRLSGPAKPGIGRSIHQY